MAQYHTHDTHDHGTVTTVDEDTGSPSVFLAVIAIVLIGFLIWLFAFSGVMFDRDSGVPARDETNVETNVEQPPAPAPQQNTQENTQENAPVPGSS